ncbi:uncharacterized protein LOC110999702 isoform X1 [Pieris rapae]|uniref:uncharacterized protein LOC110999702 isoform X1 n=1 Tax=Pieris rapae TaxID=64459 RepID=UPI001E27B395|nr:uncharacterized protein LOC110999702 isoform X1 [Pieris rapae]
MACCANLAPALLLHVNLLLMVLVGGVLLTGLRACWDPTLYVPARELFPLEYRVTAVLLPTLALVTLLACHASILALRCHRRSLRRVLLYLYAAILVACSIAQTACGAWVWARSTDWAQGEQAREVRRAAALGEHLQPLLEELAQWPSLPQIARVAALMREARDDLPRQLRAMSAAAIMLLTLQLLAALLALISAIGPPRRAPSILTLSTPLRVAVAKENLERYTVTEDCGCYRMTAKRTRHSLAPETTCASHYSQLPICSRTC